MSTPGRAERRRLERAAARKKIPTMIVGDSIAAIPLPGELFEAKPGRQLPVKTPGRHRMVALAGYVIDDADVERLEDEHHPKFLDQAHLFELGIVCYDCEEPYGNIKPGSTCPAPAGP